MKLSIRHIIPFIAVSAVGVLIFGGVKLTIDSQKQSDYYNSLEKGACLMISTKIDADALEKPLKVTFLHEKDRVMFFEVDGEINSIRRNSDYNRIVRCSDIDSQGALL